ncbi:MAG: hypothetical protein A2X94_15170 [Bdellovibrionales bacterium GWB1_55_8]|nr:MAG: hypothetical protein A2X94_15170 [Bdellovibrionales bacterium GWB1_55_8]
MTFTKCVIQDTRQDTRPAKRLIAAFLIFVGVLQQVPSARAVEAHPGSAAESLYSEAVLAYNRKQSQEAVKILDGLLKTVPDHLGALELMALTLKEAGNDLKALEVYERLLLLKPDQAGPYHFELGVIRHRQKKTAQAAEHFQKALALEFNADASHLFLGLIRFEAGNLNAAEKHFSEVRKSGSKELKMVGHYYGGMIQFKNGQGATGTAEIGEARALARELPDSKMASDIAASSDKILAPFNVPQWFSSLNFLGQYDSNISLIPSGTASAQVSRMATPNVILSGGGGRMSSPVGSVQWVGSYRFNFNKTLNAEAKSYDFFSQTPALYFTYKPLGRTSLGMKIEGNVAFQNRSENPSDPDMPYQFRPYSMGADIGPFLRHGLSDNWQLQFEIGGRTQKNFSDTNLSGKALTARLSAKGSTRSPLLNPGFTASFEKNQATGNEEKYQSMGAGVSNQLRFAAGDTLSASADLLLSNYPESSMLRSDTNLVGRLSYIHRFNAKWSLLGDLTYVKNTSTDAELNSYDRMTAGVGIGWTL